MQTLFFSDVGPGSPRPTSPVPTIVLPMFGARHRALAPINRLQPADAGVCASRSGGGTSDNRTLPEYSPRPACDGGGHCATAGTPTQNAAYACGVCLRDRLDATGCACDAGPAMHCGGRGKLRLTQCVPRTVRNGAHLRRSSLDKVCRDNSPLECSVCLNELQVCVRMRMRSTASRP